DPPGQPLDHRQRVDSLPPEMAGVHVDADIPADIGCERFEAGGSEDCDARVKFEADHEVGSHFAQALADHAPERTHLVLKLPGEQILAVAGSRPTGEDAQRAAARPGRAPAHGDEPVHPKRCRKIEGSVETGLGIGALFRVGVEEVTGSIHRGEPQAELRKLALELVAFLPAADRCKVEMRSRPWSPGADSELDIADAALGAPGEELSPVKFRQRVGIDADSHVIVLRNAEGRSAISRRLQPAPVGDSGFSHSTCNSAWATSAAPTNPTCNSCIALSRSEGFRHPGGIVERAL